MCFRFHQWVQRCSAECRVCAATPRTSPRQCDNGRGPHCRGLQSDDDETVNLTESMRWWSSTSHASSRRKLTGGVNKCQENVKSIAGVTLGHNLKAMPGLSEAVADATLLIFVTPHQLIKGLRGQIQPSLSPGAHGHVSHQGHGRRPTALTCVCGARCRMFRPDGRQHCQRNRSRALQ